MKKEVSEQEMIEYLNDSKEQEILVNYRERLQNEFLIPSSQADGMVKAWMEWLKLGWNG